MKVQAMAKSGICGCLTIFLLSIFHNYNKAFAMDKSEKEENTLYMDFLEFKKEAID